MSNPPTNRRTLIRAKLACGAPLPNIQLQVPTARVHRHSGRACLSGSQQQTPTALACCSFSPNTICFPLTSGGHPTAAGLTALLPDDDTGAAEEKEQQKTKRRGDTHD